MPEIEREEIRAIYAAKGFSGPDLDCVVRTITGNERVWIETMMREEHGLSTDGVEMPVLPGFMTFISFLIFGAIPILPYMVAIVSPESRLSVAGISTAAALFLLGVLRSWVTKQRPFWGVVEVLSIGMVCALAAFTVGVLLRGIVPLA